MKLEDLECNEQKVNIYKKLSTYGIAILPSKIPSTLCDAAVTDVIQSWHSEPSNYVAKKKKRLHHQLQLTENIKRIVKISIASNAGHLCKYLSEQDPRLVELGSITSFPGATQQRAHREYNHWPAQIQIRLLINLVSIQNDMGPLHVVPGSCFNESNRFAEHEVVKLLLPQGSITIKDVNTVHWGGPNTSNSSFRPMIYFGIGKGDGRNVNWYIKKELKNKFSISSFC